MSKLFSLKIRKSGLLITFCESRIIRRGKDTPEKKGGVERKQLKCRKKN